MKKLAILAVLLFSPLAMSQGLGLGLLKGDQIQGQDQAQGQAQGQDQGQVQGQTQGQTSDNRNTNLNGAAAGAAAGAISGSRSSSVSDSTAVSTAVTGDSRSTSGSTAISGGNTTAQGVSVDASDQSITVVQNEWDYPVASAASVYAATCQTGISGQSKEFGASFVGSDALCDAMKLTVFWAQAVEAEQDPDKKAEYMDRYYESLEAVNDLGESSEAVAKVDRWFGFALKPIAILGVLAFLL